MRYGINTEMENLNEQLKNCEKPEIEISESEVESSESEIEKKQIKKTKKHKTNETTVIYLLRSQEELRLECDIIKMKYYKLKSKNDVMEERAHYTKLDMSNLMVERDILQQKVNGYFFTLIFSMIINITILSLTIYTR
jgi:hypothetical protein